MEICKKTTWIFLTVFNIVTYTHAGLTEKLGEPIDSLIADDRVIERAWEYLQLHPAELMDGSGLCHAHVMALLEILSQTNIQALSYEQKCLLLLTLLLPPAPDSGLQDGAASSSTQLFRAPHFPSKAQYVRHIENVFQLRINHSNAERWMKLKHTALQLISGSYLFLPSRQGENFQALTKRAMRVLRRMTVQPRVELRFCQGIDGFNSKTKKYRVYAVNSQRAYAHYTSSSQHRLIIGYGSQQEPEADGKPTLVVYLQGNPEQLVGRDLFNLVESEAALHDHPVTDDKPRHIVHFETLPPRGRYQTDYGKRLDPTQLRPGSYFSFRDETYVVLERGYEHFEGLAVVAKVTSSGLHIMPITMQPRHNEGLIFDDIYPNNEDIPPFYDAPPVCHHQATIKIRRLGLEEEYLPRFHLRFKSGRLFLPPIYDHSRDECLLYAIEAVKQFTHPTLRSFNVELHYSLGSQTLWSDLHIDLDENCFDYRDGSGRRYPLPISTEPLEKNRLDITLDRRGPWYSRAKQYGFRPFSDT